MYSSQELKTQSCGFLKIVLHGSQLNYRQHGICNYLNNIAISGGSKDAAQTRSEVTSTLLTQAVKKLRSFAEKSLRNFGPSARVTVSATWKMRGGRKEEVMRGELRIVSGKEEEGTEIAYKPRHCW